jgi:ATP-dependent Clp protease ATP-binding subunit ClpA
MVFDFIREDVAVEIFDSMVENLVRKAKDSQGVTIEISPEARAALRGPCLADLSNGGRGIRNQLEVHFVNPLARFLFDEDVPRGATLKIAGLATGAATSLVATF